jgi:hypothetical protein
MPYNAALAALIGQRRLRLRCLAVLDCGRGTLQNALAGIRTQNVGNIQGLQQASEYLPSSLSWARRASEAPSVRKQNPQDRVQLGGSATLMIGETPEGSLLPLPVLPRLSLQTP